MSLKLEVVIIPISDVDRAKAFYEKLGWRLDGDFDGGEKLRVIQVTPPRSETSVIFGKGITSAKPGSASGLVLAVDNLEAARAELIERGAKVSEVFHFAGLPFNNSVDNARISGRDPEGRTYFTFASFEDPDRNQWLLQEITTRFPGREWDQKEARPIDVATLAELLHETSEHTMTTTRRRTPSIIGGTGTLPTWARVRTAMIRRRQPLLPTVTWMKSIMFLPNEEAHR
jgi:catechol 2,3-dioxygenase-like lactoylglutathione lyase family enzyme